MRRLDYAWRLCCTGIAFAFIFFGGALLALTAGPISRVMGRNSPKRMRFLIHCSFSIYIRLLQVLRVISLDVVGREKLDAKAGRMIIANHPSILDVVLLIAIIPQAQCIVKHQLWNHRLLGRLMKAAGFIRNDLEPAALIDACKKSFDEGDSLIIFPEGTRSVPGTEPKMQRGFANIATMTSATIQPIFITCNPPTLLKGEAWWHIPPTRPHFQLTVDECLDAASYLEYEEGCRSLSARKLLKFVENYYVEQKR